MMKSAARYTFRFSLFFLLFLALNACKSNDDMVVQEEEQVEEEQEEQGEEDLLVRLNNIDGITATELPSEDHFARLFEVWVTQPIDHNNPSGVKFQQKVYIGHVDENEPVIFETEGYSRSSHRTREISFILGLNQIAVEHRFNGDSKPNSIDWTNLTIWQAANDHHRIVELLKPLYSGRWVSSGVSKGGDTALFHRRFFPNDVAGTVAFVAPILFEERDVRFLEYFESQGDEACRQKMRDYQRNMLLNIDEFPPLFDDYVDFVNTTYGTDITFSLSYEAIVYFATREDYAFEFWSSETENCDSIPENDASVQELFDHFVAVFDIFLFFSDFGTEFWTPWYYQSLTEIGNYAFDASHLEDLEMEFDPLVDLGISTTFDPTAMNDFANWFATEAENVILIYGADDPWTVGALEANGNESVLRIVNPGTKHSTGIYNLGAGDRGAILEMLDSWLNQKSYS